MNMKLKAQFITHETGTESLLVPAGDAAFSGLVKGNKTFGIILEYLKTDTTKEKIISAMKARFDAPEEVISRDVNYAVSSLRKIGALDEV